MESLLSKPKSDVEAGAVLSMHLQRAGWRPGTRGRLLADNRSNTKVATGKCAREHKGRVHRARSNSPRIRHEQGPTEWTVRSVKRRPVLVSKIVAIELARQAAKAQAFRADETAGLIETEQCSGAPHSASRAALPRLAAVPARAGSPGG